MQCAVVQNQGNRFNATRRLKVLRHVYQKAGMVVLPNGQSEIEKWVKEKR
jgi:hypothetical protein